jgi:class 3 adenylate cyclase
MADATAHVDDLVRRTIEASKGVVIKSTGDGVMAVFEDADEAVSAAIAGQRALASGSAPIELDIRMGLCTGPATRAITTVRS